MTSTVAAIIAGCVAVTFGCVWGVASIALGRRTRNWLYYVETVGSVLLVAGIVGQRYFPSDDAVARMGLDNARQASPGLWESSIPVPGFAFYLTPIAVVGLVVLAAGAALLLFFEGAQPAANVPNDLLNPLEADDAN